MSDDAPAQELHAAATLTAKSDGPPTAKLPARRKLGLALAGGGFRASLFHIGVLRRMAELDLLRRVEVLSTVSGGSIVGALYTLVLKREMLQGDQRRGSRDLEQETYAEIVDEVDRRLTQGIERNLRNRAFQNPFVNFWMLASSYSLSERMARLYERFLFKDVAEELWQMEQQHAAQRAGAPKTTWAEGEKASGGRIPLREIRAVWSGEALPGGIETYNVSRTRQPGGSVVTHHVINATTVNSGGRFFFASNEVGDWYLGYARYSEAAALERAKQLLDALPPRRRKPLADLAAGPAVQTIGDTKYPRSCLVLARWLDDPRTLRPDEDGAEWDGILKVAGVAALARTDLGYLRQAKIPAWYYRIGTSRQMPIGGGIPADQHVMMFRAALQEIDPRMAKALETDYCSQGPDAYDRLADFVLTLYALRSAQALAPDLSQDLDHLTLGTAVGASACFPPVFSPIMLQGLYDNAHVARLGLTDGGVFDNVGVVALLNENCTHIVASDTGGTFDRQPHARASRLALSMRLANVLMKVVADFQRLGLNERHVTYDTVSKKGFLDRLEDFFATRALPNLAFFHIGSPLLRDDGPEGWPLDRELIARLRTDLDLFGEIERDALVNQGYVTADHYLRTYLTDFKPDGSDDDWGFSRPELPRTPPAGEERARWERVLEIGASRFFRSIRLWAIVPVVVTLAAVAFVLRGLWHVSTDLGGAVASLGVGLGSVGAGIRTAGLWWGEHVPLLISVMVVAGAVAWLLKGSWQPALRAWIEERNPPWDRRFATLEKWAGGVWRFVWLCVPALVLAVVLFAYAWINQLLFQRPFRRVSRVHR